MATQRIFSNTKKIFFNFLAVATILSGCAKPAPLEDGAYLRYRYISDDFSGTCEIKFSRVDKRHFEVTVEDPKGLLSKPFAISHEKDGRVLVDRFMRARNGRPFEMEALGPIWVDARRREKGGRTSLDSLFSGTTTDEIKQWKKWKAYVVNATAFRGALSGTWYYDMGTGFLVGLEQKTVMTSILMPHPPYWMLEDTNIQAPDGAAAPASKPAVQGPEGTMKQQAPTRTQVITLKNGRQMTAVIVKNAENYVIIEIEGGTITMNKEDIETIEPIE